MPIPSALYFLLAAASGSGEPSAVLAPAAEVVEQNVTVPLLADTSGTAIPEQKCHAGLSKYQGWHLLGKALFPKQLRVQPDSFQIDLGSGPIRIQGMVLEKYVGPYQVEISLVRDANLAKASTVLIPSLAILDEKFCELKAPYLPDFSFRRTPIKFMFSAKPDAERAVIPITDSEPRYIVIFSDMERVGGEVRFKDANYGFTMGQTVQSEFGFVNVQRAKLED